MNKLPDFLHGCCCSRFCWCSVGSRIFIFIEHISTFSKFLSAHYLVFTEKLTCDKGSLLVEVLGDAVQPRQVDDTESQSCSTISILW
jgi:hypothetical protein